jgi:hypothetical protein
MRDQRAIDLSLGVARYVGKSGGNMNGRLEPRLPFSSSNHEGEIVRKLAEGHEQIGRDRYRQFLALGLLGSGADRRSGSDLAAGLSVAEVHKMLEQMTEDLTAFRTGDQASTLLDLSRSVTREGLSPAELGHLRAIEFQLDQCWDLLDQFEARLATRPNRLGSADRSRGRTT